MGRVEQIFYTKFHNCFSKNIYTKKPVFKNKKLLSLPRNIDIQIIISSVE